MRPSAASSASISALCFLSSAILFVCTGASAAPRLAEGRRTDDASSSSHGRAAASRCWLSTQGEQQLVSSRSLVVHNEKDFEQRLLSRISACGVSCWLCNPRSLPHLAGLAGREESSELRKLCGASAVWIARCASGAGHENPRTPARLASKLPSWRAVPSVSARGACRERTHTAHAAYSK